MPLQFDPKVEGHYPPRTMRGAGYKFYGDGILVPMSLKKILQVVSGLCVVRIGAVRPLQLPLDFPEGGGHQRGGDDPRHYIPKGISVHILPPDPAPLVLAWEVPDFYFPNLPCWVCIPQDTQRPVPHVGLSPMIIIIIIIILRDYLIISRVCQEFFEHL